MMGQKIISKEASKAALERPLLVNGLDVSKVVDAFEDRGYVCQVGSELIGSSGIHQPFDIIASKGAEIVVIDLMSFRSSILDTPASDYEISAELWKCALTMRIKSWDCGLPQSIILHLSSYLCNGEQVLVEHDPLLGFLSQFNIKLFSSADMQQAAKKLEMFLSEAA